MTARAAGLVAPAAFAVAAFVLLAAGRGDLAAPPVADLGSWAEEVGPIVAAVALLRLTALAAAGTMLVVTSLSALARLVGAARVAGTIDRALPPPLRRALGGLAGIGVVGAVTVGVAGGPGVGAASAPPPGIERLVRLPADPADPPVADPADPPVADPADPPLTETMAVLPEEAAPTPGPPPAIDEWIVGPGDSFWSIAAEVVTERLGRMPAEAEVVPYWQAVIAANRDRLVSADADLVFPGQVLILPS